MTTTAGQAHLPYGAYRGTNNLTTTERGFLGQTEDPTSNLVYLNNRYYDAGVGRFASVDPLTEMTRGSYSYAGASPVAFSDPSGLCYAAADIGSLMVSVNGEVPTVTCQSDFITSDDGGLASINGETSEDGCRICDPTAWDDDENDPYYRNARAGYYDEPPPPPAVNAGIFALPNFSRPSSPTPEEWQKTMASYRAASAKAGWQRTMTFRGNNASALQIAAWAAEREAFDMPSAGDIVDSALQLLQHAETVQTMITYCGAGAVAGAYAGLLTGPGAAWGVPVLTVGGCAVGAGLGYLSPPGPGPM